MSAGAICDMSTRVDRRVRKRCPFHKVLHYGVRRDYYDTMRVFFDCGTEADYGYGYYRPPRDVLRKRWRDAKRRQRARLPMAGL